MKNKLLLLTLVVFVGLASPKQAIANEGSSQTNNTGGLCDLAPSVCNRHTIALIVTTVLGVCVLRHLSKK